MIKRELAKDEKLKNESWDRFLPHFKKQNIKKKKPQKTSKKDKSLFPPAQTPRKIDLELESGQYFLDPKEKAQRKTEEKKVRLCLASRQHLLHSRFLTSRPAFSTLQQAQAEKAVEKAEQRQSAFKAPVEQPKKAKQAKDSSEPTIESLKAKFAAEAKARASRD